MRLERVLFPDDAEYSWGKETSKSSISRKPLADNSNRRGGKTKARRGKKQQQKHRIGKQEESASNIMNPYANKPTKRKKKISRSSNQGKVQHTDSQIDTTETAQSSLELNDTKSSISFVSEPLLHSLGATDSLMFLGSISGNARSKIDNSMSRRKSEQTRNQRGRVTKRARDFVTKLEQENASSCIAQDNRASVAGSGKSGHTKVAPNAETTLTEKPNGKLPQKQPKSRRPKRQRDSNENKSKLRDSQVLHNESGGEASKEGLGDAAADTTTNPNRKRVVKFATQPSEGRRGKRTKGKLHVSSGGLNSLCGLDNHRFSFPVPDPVLNRSVLVSPLSLEGFDSGVSKHGGKRRKNTKKSTTSKRECALRDGENTKKASVKPESEQPTSLTRIRQAEVLSKKHCEAPASNQVTPKRSHEQPESELDSVCLSFTQQSPESLSKNPISRDMSHASNMSIHGCASKLPHDTMKKVPAAKALPLAKSRITNSRHLLSLSQSWDLDSPNTSMKREALKQGAGAYVLEVEEADLSKSLNSSLEQKHRVADNIQANDASNCARLVSTLQEEQLENSSDKENIEKKPVQTRESVMEGTGEKERSPHIRRSGRSVDGNVKNSERLSEPQKSSGLAEKKEMSAVEPTPLRRSKRARRSSISNDDKENIERKPTSVRRSGRKVARPRRLGQYEGDDDSAYIPTPSARSASKKTKKPLCSKASAKKATQKTTHSPEEQEGTKEDEVITNEWSDNDVLLLREAQKEVDPKSYSYWQDVADLVGRRSAEECQEKWFSLAKTPNIRRKKKDKENQKEIPITPQDDDIFDATPMKALFSTSFGDEDPLMGSMGFLSKLNLGSAVKVDRVPVDEEESNKLATKRGYKTYIRDMKREVHAKDKSKKTRLPKGGNSKVKNLRDCAEEGDIELKGRLSPGGTLHMTSNVDGDIDDGYSDDEECDDIDSFFPKIQSQ